jgi:hypothetical protein
MTTNKTNNQHIETKLNPSNIVQAFDTGSIMKYALILCIVLSVVPPVLATDFPSVSCSTRVKVFLPVRHAQAQNGRLFSVPSMLLSILNDETFAICHAIIQQGVRKSALPTVLALDIIQCARDIVRSKGKRTTTWPKLLSFSAFIKAFAIYSFPQLVKVKSKS